jgi:hypothetical protein
MKDFQYYIHIIWNELLESDSLGKGGMTFWHMMKKLHGAKKVENHWCRLYSVGRGILKVLCFPSICMEGLRKITKHFGRRIVNFWADIVPWLLPSMDQNCYLLDQDVLYVMCWEREREREYCRAYVATIWDGYWIDNWIYWITHSYTQLQCIHSYSFTVHYNTCRVSSLCLHWVPVFQYLTRLALQNWLTLGPNTHSSVFWRLALCNSLYSTEASL